MILVVGYGNELRRDDGVGPLVAREVASWGLPGVVAVASHGLVPELAEALSRADRAVFVDARASDRVEVTVLAPGPPSALGHGSDPGWLLALAAAAFGRAPRAWLVTVAAGDFGYGEGLSGAAAAGMAAALERVRELVQEERIPCSIRLGSSGRPSPPQ